MGRAIWSRDKDRDFARRYMAGEPLDDIALALDSTRASLTTRASTLGLRRRKTADGHQCEGNAQWLTGEALRVAVPLSTEAFAPDLLGKLGRA